MFAVIMIVIGVTIYFYNLTRDAYTDNRRRNRAKENGDKFWINRYGHKIDTETGIPYSIEVRPIFKNGHFVRYGDTIYYNPRNGKVIRNKSQEWRDKRALERKQWKTEAINKGEKYYLYDKKKSVGDGYRAIDKRFEFEGYGFNELPDAPVMYADVNTDQRYFVLCAHRFGNILVNVDTFKFEKIVDEETLPPDKIEKLKGIMEWGNQRTRKELIEDNNINARFCTCSWSKDLHY